MSQTKYEAVKNECRRRIDAGDWRPGEVVTSERELSQELGVSRITVKRAFADLIDEGLLTRVPGRRGTLVNDRTPARRRARFIGAAIDDIRDTFGSELLRGIEDYFWDRRIHTLLCNGDRSFAKVEEYFSSLTSHEIAGVIFAPVIDHGYARNNTRLVTFLQRHGLPFVLVDRYVPGMLANYVAANHRESSRLIVEELLRAGHRRVLIAVGLECTSMDERVQGYRDAHEEAGVRVDESLIVRGNDSLLHPAPDGEELARFADRVRHAGAFSCFYALNSRLLNAGIQVLRELGLEPGTKVRVASHDEPRAGSGASGPVVPPYAVQPAYQMGWEASRILLDHIATPRAPIVRMTLKAAVVSGA